MSFLCFFLIPQYMNKKEMIVARTSEIKKRKILNDVYVCMYDG